jgi:hypothetical protein
MTLELISIKREIIQDEDPDYSYLEQDYSDCPKKEAEKYKAEAQARLESLFNGQWTFIGIGATAEIRINGIYQIISSGRLWGIEDDSGEEYLNEVYTEQVAELKDQLKEIGFSESQILEAAN